VPGRSLATARLDDLLATRLAVAGRLLRTQADAELSHLGVGAQSLGTLLRLAEDDGLTQAELSRRQRVEAPTMCRMIDRLERDGLVERRADPADRRATRVSLSAEGREVAARGAAVVDALERRAFEGLDGDERRRLGELLGRVLDGLGTEGAPPS
jgi:MarR family transcriptional regulator, transcriptional regulator for hemolysin